MGKLTIEETNFMQVGFENSLEEFKNIVKTGEKKPFKVGDLLQVKELNTRNDYWDKVRDQLVHSITHPYGCNIGG